MVPEKLFKLLCHADELLSGVKSYPNAVVSIDSKQLSEYSSMQSSWSWSYTGSDIVADVSYDMFTSSSAGGSNEYEIMIWLGALGGAGPISSEPFVDILGCVSTNVHHLGTYGADGSATPVATPTVAGTSWKLYKGPNGSTTVFSFLADSQVNDFSGDIMDFFDYLTSNEGLPDSQYLISVGAGK